MTRAIADWQAEAKILEASGLVDDQWYKGQYPDVRILGMQASEHYLKYGASMGRNPSPVFDTRFYLTTYPDVGPTGKNPLLHYLLHGREEGRYGHESDRQDPIRRISEARRRIRTLGFTIRPIEDLKALIDEAPAPHIQALARTEIALWHYHKATAEDYAQSLSYLEQAIKQTQDHDLKARLIVLQLLCLYHMENMEKGRALFETAEKLDLVSADTCLARANFEGTPEGRLFYINRALSLSEIPEITLRDCERSPYDRIMLTEPPVNVLAKSQGKISVIIAAHNAADTLPTALLSLQAQTWQNIEIIVVDDASTDNTSDIVTRFSLSDSRIRLIQLRQNGGAYVARNFGLDMVNGDFVTLHDADDWSHPLKLETQARCLLAEPDLIGCTSQQARAQDDLTFLRCTDDGQLIFPNTSSLMFRKKAVRAVCGYWDNVRFSADNELIRRIRKIFGHKAIRHLKTGPLSFQRHSQTSIVAHPAFGINGSPYGIRHEYFEAQTYHHKRANSLLYTNSLQYRPFPVPEAMLDQTVKTQHFDVIIATDFRRSGNYAATVLAHLAQIREAGLTAGLVQLNAYDVDPNPHCLMDSSIRETIDGQNIQIVTYGERAACGLLLVLEPDVLKERQHFIPDLSPKRVEIIKAHAHSPMLPSTDENAQHYFNCTSDWVTVSSLTEYIVERLEDRKNRLNQMFDASERHTVFYNKLTTELLPALNAEFISALQHSQQALPPPPPDTETLVSIIMPTFNRAHIITEALQSILDQTYTNWELFVCDDGSTDNTADLIKRISDPRIFYLPLEKIGAAAARNAGLKQSRGRIIAYLDSDNYWHPNYLVHVVLNLNSAGSCKKPLTIFSNYIDYQISEFGVTSVESWQRPAFDHSRLLQKNFIDLNTFAHHRAYYDAFGGFNPALKRRQDYDLIIKYTWLQDPLQSPHILALYQRNVILEQITRSQGHDTSCIDIIDKSIETYFRTGLPLSAPYPDAYPLRFVPEPETISYPENNSAYNNAERAARIKISRSSPEAQRAMAHLKYHYHKAEGADD